MNVCWVQISSGATHSDLVSKNISLDLDLLLVAYRGICTTKQSGWPFDRECVHYFKENNNTFKFVIHVSTETSESVISS